MTWALPLSGTTAAPPRILLACDWFVKYSSDLAAALADLGCQVALVTRTHDFEFGGEPGAMRGYVERSLAGKGKHHQLGGRVRELSALRDLRRVRRAVRELAPGVVHLQDSVVNDVRLLWAAGARPGRFALTVHDPWPHSGDPPPGSWKRAVRRALVRRAALLFVHGHALRDQLFDRYDPAAPVVVVPHGAGKALRSPVPDRPSLLFFGRISYYKGLDTLLDAMPLVWRRLPQASLTVAGEGPIPAHPVLEDPRVTVRHEHVPEEALPALFSATTCVVLPYRQASQTAVGALAKRYGRAIVSTDVGALPELVRPDSGRIVAKEDPAALAAAVVEVIATPGLARAMGDAAVAAVEAEIGWPRIAELTLEAYRRHLPGGAL